MLLAVPDWKRVVSRPCPPREGKPVVGLDLGASRSWTGVHALFSPMAGWRRSPSWPGIPSLADRERQDAAPRGSYQALADAGSLIVDEGLRVTLPRAALVEIGRRGRRPSALLCDLFKLPELRDSTKLSDASRVAPSGASQRRTSARSGNWRWTAISQWTRKPYTSFL